MALISNAALGAQIDAILVAWETNQDEFQAWIGGTVNGGANLDGTYPLTDRDGNIRLTLCPAQLEDNVSGPVADAVAAQAAAEAAQALAETAATTSTTQAGLAATARTNAEAAQTAAELAETGAQNEAANALTSANNASTSETNAAASEAAALVSEGAADDSAGYASEWAITIEDTLVSVAAGGDGATDYSALHHAAKAAASAAAAATFDPAFYAALADAETITGAWSLPATTTIDGITATNLVDKSATETITGAWTFNSQVTLGDGNSTSGDVLLYFNTDRAWSFETFGADSTADLSLVAQTNGKFFNIRDALDITQFQFLTVDTTPYFRAYDSTGTDYIQITGSSTQAVIESTQHIQLTPATGHEVFVYDPGTAAVFAVYDGTGNDAGKFSHNGSNFSAAFVNTGLWNITGLTDGLHLNNSGYFQITGSSMYIADSTGSDYSRQWHDGTDSNISFTNTTDWNITGATTIKIASAINVGVDTSLIFQRGSTDGDYAHTILSPGGAYYYNDASTPTGAIRLALPSAVVDGSTMTHYVIRGYNYGFESGAWELRVGGYNYGPQAWTNTSAHVLCGNPPFKRVRFGHEGTTRPVLILGETTTQWSYPKVQVEAITPSYAGQNTVNWRSGWAGTLVTTITDTINRTAYPAIFPRGGASDSAAGQLQFSGPATWNGTLGYLQEVTGNYGSVQAGGAAGTSGGYAGFSVNGRLVLMNNNSTISGLYDDTNNEWFLRCVENSSVELYYNGVGQLITQGNTNTGQTTGATIKNHNGSNYDVGMNVLPTFNLGVSDTLEANHCGKITGKTNSTAMTITGPTSSALDFPVNGVTTVINFNATGNVTINDTATCTMYYCSGSAVTDIAGGGTLAPGGMVTLWRSSTATIYIWGSGFTA